MNPTNNTIDYAGKGYSSMADYLRYSNTPTTPTQQVTNEKFATPQSPLIGTQSGSGLTNIRVNPTITADTLAPTTPITLPPKQTDNTANIGLGASIAGTFTPSQLS